MTSKIKVNYIEEMVTKEIEDFDPTLFQPEEDYVTGYYKGHHVEISLEDYKKIKENERD